MTLTEEYNNTVFIPYEAKVSNKSPNNKSVNTRFDSVKSHNKSASTIKNKSKKGSHLSITTTYPSIIPYPSHSTSNNSYYLHNQDMLSTQGAFEAPESVSMLPDSPGSVTSFNSEQAIGLSEYDLLEYYMTNINHVYEDAITYDIINRLQCGTPTPTESFLFFSICSMSIMLKTEDIKGPMFTYYYSSAIELMSTIKHESRDSIYYFSCGLMEFIKIYLDISIVNKLY
ncbi:hypothetical protein K502DRAFT_148132 [Neoconidiobolus thromboides FSU 785]|nr:hypothetical protein K502DRAFT_148132 [Neoconidiobolus thromboides FSU 785]